MGRRSEKYDLCSLGCWSGLWWTQMVYFGWNCSNQIEVKHFFTFQKFNFGNIYNYTECPTKDEQRMLRGPIIDHIDQPCLVKLELVRNPENGETFHFCLAIVNSSEWSNVKSLPRNLSNNLTLPYPYPQCNMFVECAWMTYRTWLLTTELTLPPQVGGILHHQHSNSDNGGHSAVLGRSRANY